MKRLLIAIALLTLACDAQKIKTTEWLTGILLEQKSEHGSNVSSYNGNITETGYTNTYYRIDAGQVIYVAVRDIHLRWDKLLKLTTNAPIKYCIRGRHIYILDEDGKQHTLDLEEKILKKKPDDAK